MLRITRRDWVLGAGAGFAGVALCGAFPRSSYAAAASAPAVTNELMAIPAGMCWVGSAPADVETLASTHGYHVSWMISETPKRLVYLPAFEIQRFPVTHREFADFCAATGYPPRPSWPSGLPPAALLDHPVNQVNRADALAYAAWAGLRLPTEVEWEKAARGVDGRTFPWGDVFDPDACQWNRDPSLPPIGTAPVDAHPSGASPYGVEDLIGNLAEWCANGPSSFAGYIKGGAYNTSELVNLRAAARNMSGALTNASRFYGFRCARNAP